MNFRSTALADLRPGDRAGSTRLGVSAGQVSAIVPYSVGNGATANASGSGPGAIRNQDLSVNTASNPAQRGSIVVLYATGEGETDPGGVDGQVAASVFPKPKQPVAVRIGGVNAEILYAGAAPSLVAGVMQINAKVPDNVPDGPVPIQIVVGNTESPAGVTVAILGDLIGK